MAELTLFLSYEHACAFENCRDEWNPFRKYHICTFDLNYERLYDLYNDRRHRMIYHIFHICMDVRQCCKVEGKNKLNFVSMKNYAQLNKTYCVRMWTIKLLLCWNDLPQTVHWKFLSPVWITWCFLMLVKWLNVLSQMLHWYGLSPVWLFKIRGKKFIRLKWKTNANLLTFACVLFYHMIAQTVFHNDHKHEAFHSYECDDVSVMQCKDFSANHLSEWIGLVQIYL